MKNNLKTLVGITVIAICILSLTGILIMVLWNTTLVSSIGVAKISFLQAVGIKILCLQLFSQPFQFKKLLNNRKTENKNT